MEEDRTLDVVFDDDDNLIISLEDGSSEEHSVLNETTLISSTNHAELSHRDDPDQHSIASITGLSSVLEELYQHIEDEEVHTNAEEKAAWNSKTRVYRNASGALVISL